MSQELLILTATAASIGFFHTLLGPDHYLPFIAMAKARKWSIMKTSWITIMCGAGHVGSSILLGILGVIFGIGISKIEFFEGMRGNLAGWAFLIFGAGYFIYGIYRAMKNKPHSHIHIHKKGKIHTHTHDHENEHDHKHKNITPWILFTIFVLGPCEPLIPILMYPAASNSTGSLIFITLLFAVITILTMLTIVLLATYGLKIANFGKLERYSHALAGFIILFSGTGILFLGL